METEAVEDMLNENPLVLFSLYTAVQFQSLSIIRSDLLEIKPQRLKDCFCAVYQGEKHYALLWLWFIGANEALRTMSENSSCFEKEVFDKIGEKKRKIAKLRVPFENQKFCG
jgi:hypothetical protein